MKVPPHIGQTECAVAQVVPLLKLRHLGDRRFDYIVPAHLQDLVAVGSVLEVTFSRRQVRAVVVGLANREAIPPRELQTVASVEAWSIPLELVDLADKVAARYLSSLESCLRLVAPPRGGQAVARPASLGNTWVVRTAGTPTDLGGQPESPQPSTEEAPAQASRLTPKQRQILAAVQAEGCLLRNACAEAGAGLGVGKALICKGLLQSAHPTESGEPAGEGQPPDQASDAPTLLPEQESALETLLAAYADPGLSTRQLWGVTGSGKTEVYLRLLAKAVSDGVGAILLVPEIALTPQMISRVRSRFGERVGLLHSGLTPLERRKEYARIRSGVATLVVGARSAVFAPVRDLRLVILDESHDSSYKQEEEPRYHARTVAQLRLQQAGGLLLEGSATPAVEAMEKESECLRLSAAKAATGCWPP
jgi:primosomal protein N' (replication factor Y)